MEKNSHFVNDDAAEIHRIWYFIVMRKSSGNKKRVRAEAGDGKSIAGPPQIPDKKRSSQESSRRGTELSAYYLAASVSLITFLVYLPSIYNGFIQWDDQQYVVGNPYLRSLNSAFLKWAFLNFHAANWHPLTWISHAFDFALWGLNPLGHHLANIVLHACNTFAAVVLTLRLTETWRKKNIINGPEAFPDHRAVLITGGVTGLLFGLHPVHVESVAWVAERKDLLCAMFFMLSIIMYTKYVNVSPDKTNRVKSGPLLVNKQYLFSIGFFSLALLSKPMAVSLPVVLLILDWHPFGRIRSFETFRSAFIGKLPFIALSLISSILTFKAQKAGETMSLMEVVPLPVRLLVAAKSLIAYLWKMMLPVTLIPYYPYPKTVSLLLPEYLSAIVLTAGITAACFILAGRHKLWLSVWGYYIATLLPVLGLVQVGAQAMADRYTYLPGLGPFLVIGLAAAWFFNKSQTVGEQGRMSGLVIIAASVFLFFTLAYLTVKQTRIWKDDFTLWNYVVEKQPGGVAFAYTNRGAAYIGMGRYDMAIGDLNKAISLEPSDYKAYNNLGIALENTGQFDRAIEDFNKAVTLNPAFYEAYNYRGIVFGETGQFDRAAEDFNKAIALNPASYEAYQNRGILYGEAGLFDKSIDSLTRSVEINPYNADAYVSRGNSFARSGRNGKAFEDFNKAILLNHSHSMAYLNRGNLYRLTDHRELALSDFQKACNLGNTGGCDAAKALKKQ